MSREYASFRDPSGRTFVASDRVRREVSPSAWPDLDTFFKSRVCRDLEREGRIVSTKRLPQSDSWIVLEHEKVQFPSYPYEWPPEMLHSAGELTIELAERTLNEGFGIKDATPQNILFRGSKPVFVDLLSFEQRNSGDPIWLPYSQFIRNFILPLQMDRRSHIVSHRIFLTCRDGIEPETAHAMIGPIQRWLPPFLTLSTFPALLGRLQKPSDSAFVPRIVALEQARFTLRRLYRSLRKELAGASPKYGRRSIWSSYDETGPYSQEESAEKRRLIESILKDRPPVHLLDIGCNAGTYSLMAARSGTQVVSIDSDPVVIGKLWRRAQQENLNVLPLVVDIARPTPDMGWRNAESPSFLSRCAGQFDCLLLLGMLHHLLITERIPLESIIDLLADLTTNTCVIEYVASDDPMFKRLLRGRAHLHRDFTEYAFQEACSRRFYLMQRIPLSGEQRVLYVYRRNHNVPS